MFAALGSTAVSAEPAWCKAEGVRQPRTSSVERALTKGDATDALPSLVATTCWPDNDAKPHMKELDAARGYWSKRLDMTEADWADAAVWSGQDASALGSPFLQLKDDKQAWSTLSPVGQFIAISGATDTYGEHNYITDALDAHLSESGRLAFITKCLSAGDGAVQLAMCQADIDQLDHKKLAAELSGDSTYGGIEKMTVRVKLDRLDGQLRPRADAIKAFLAKDDGYKKVFAIAAQVRKDWAKIDPALTSFVLAMDDAQITNSRKATDGCSAKIWPMFKDAVSKIPAAEFANAKSVVGRHQITSDLVSVAVSHPAVYLASIGLLMCEAETTDELTREIGNAVDEWPGYRGPRTMTESMIMQAGIVLDDRSAKLHYPGFKHSYQVHGQKKRMSQSRAWGRGVIGKVKQTGEVTHVDFTKQSTKQVQCTNYKESNKIRGFDSAGNIVYDGSCLAYETVTVDATLEALDADKRYAEGLKAGMVIEPDGDLPAAAWTTNGAKTPSFVFGVAVK